MTLSPVFLRDAAERIVATAIQTFLAVFTPATVAAVVGDVSLLKPTLLAAGSAALAGALAGLKAAIARSIGDTETASLDPGLETRVAAPTLADPDPDLADADAEAPIPDVDDADLSDVTPGA